MLMLLMTAAALPPAADPGAPVPKAAYVSPFKGYQPFTDEKIAPWKASNDEVGRIGGWRAYLKENAAPAAAPPPDKPAAPPAGKPAADPHAHHKKGQ